jgi:tetratricopeptide (TPR) repeat protein
MHLLSLGSATLCVALAHPLVSADSPEEFVKKGKTALESFKYEDALAHFTTAIRLDPKNAEAYYQRGRTHFGLNQTDKSIADQNEAIRLRPKFTEAYVARGAAYFRNGDKRRAFADLNQALKIDPKNIDATSERARLYADTGDYQNARVDYEAILKIKATADVYLELSHILAACDDAKVRNGKKALEYATKGWELSDQKSEYFMPDAMAASYAELGKYDEAVIWQKKAIANMPKIFQDSAEARLKIYEMKKPFRYRSPLDWIR